METALRMPSRSGPHAGKCRLSECNTPGVLECRPGPERIPPVYSVVQQKPFQESHVVGSQFLASTQRPTCPMVPIFSESARSVQTIVFGRRDRRQTAPPAARGQTGLSPHNTSRRAVFLRDDADATIFHSRPTADAGSTGNRRPGAHVRPEAQSFRGIRRSRCLQNPRGGSAPA